jgi:hypothetical protein
MKSTALQQDYWPGYLDALVNVMLYLLLLVGSFALGMVALTLHSMEQQQQLSFLGGKESGSAALQERASQIVAEMNLTEPEKALMSARLGQMDIEAMVRRREELDREKQLEESREAQRQRAQQLARDTGERVVAEPLPTKNTPVRDAKADQLKAQLATLEEEYQNALSALDREKRLSQQQREVSSSQKVNEVIFDLRVTAKTVSAGNLTTGGRGEASTKLFDRDPKVIWEFESNQFLWGADKPVPDTLADANVSASWKLVVFADTDNSRILRESFARINSVRETLVRQGFARELIKVEVRSLQGVPIRDERLLRTVYMLPDA